MLTPLRYVLISPARNEAAFIELTIKSVVAQTVRPLKWIIVSDGSTDGTDEIVDKYVAQHAWIELVKKRVNGERNFASKVEAFNAAYARTRDLDYEVIGNLDADISFDDVNYFKFLMARLAENPRLGVCGTVYEEGEVTYPHRFASVEDVFGACQIFRRECFEAIGGYRAVKTGGIDLIALLRARAEGWQTRTFTEKRCRHHRLGGSGQHANTFERLLHLGRKDYLHGSHPLFEVFRCIYQMRANPYLVGGLLMFAGYFCAALQGIERTIPEDLVRIRQADQILRLKRVLSGNPWWGPNGKGSLAR